MVKRINFKAKLWNCGTSNVITIPSEVHIKNKIKEGEVLNIKMEVRSIVERFSTKVWIQGFSNILTIPKSMVRKNKIKVGEKLNITIGARYIMREVKVS